MSLALPVQLSLFKRVSAIIVLFVLVALINAMGNWANSHALLINMSKSLPNWAFFVHKDPNLHKGDIVFFKPPVSNLVTSHFGKNPAPFGKIIMGVPGDIIERVGMRVFINGKLVGIRKAYTKKGERLSSGPIGLIPKDYFYVGTAHPDGFDSRYAEIGLVARKDIQAKGRAVL
jgi:conjugal transfer pilin signal peptidase TrbI